jgi:hypothetical protein
MKIIISIKVRLEILCSSLLNLGIPVGCGSTITARLFFFSYSLIMRTVLMRLFIAIVLQTFGQTTERDNKFMSSELVQQFRQTWGTFDNDVRLKIKIYSEI